MAEFLDEKRYFGEKYCKIWKEIFINFFGPANLKNFKISNFSGAVPVVTRNIQERGTLSAKNIIRNPWKHNVVYRIESNFVHLSNPAEKIAEYVLRSQLSQAPLIYVRRRSLLKRWNSSVDLRALLRANNDRWYNENVLGTYE